VTDQTQRPNSAAQQPDPRGEAQLPFAGYDRMDVKQVISGLSDHSQVELEAVETYERSHESRLAVLDKLRFMRQTEPLPGYDALPAEEILAALGRADISTIKKVRGYERKFANRPAVLEEVDRVRRLHRKAHPPGPAPGYEPLSTALHSKKSGDGAGARP
jgi:hypothetical protein